MLTFLSWSVIIGLAIILAFSAVSWFAAPKGENQTYVHSFTPASTLIPIYILARRTFANLMV